MTVSLSPLETGGSLEFSTADIDRVRAALDRRYAAPEVDNSSPILTVYTFGDVKLIFQNQWDDPCLIASDPMGMAMLEQLARDLA